MNTAMLQTQLMEAIASGTDDQNPSIGFVRPFLQLAEASSAEKEEVAKGALPDFTAMLGDPEPERRRRAAGFISALGIAARSALPSMLAALRDPDRTVRCIALDSLPALGCQIGEALSAIREMVRCHPDEQTTAVIFLTIFRLGRAAGRSGHDCFVHHQGDLPMPAKNTNGKNGKTLPPDDLGKTWDASVRVSLFKSVQTRISLMKPDGKRLAYQLLELIGALLEGNQVSSRRLVQLMRAAKPKPDDLPGAVRRTPGRR